MMASLDHVMCRIQNYERDLKQKRQLLNDQKKRLNSMEDKANCDKDKIVRNM